MSRHISIFYNLIMFLTEQRCLLKWRTSLFSGVSGEVLEIGAGTGSSLSCYPDTVNHLTLAEPDQHMRRQLHKVAARHSISTSIIDSTGESLALPSDYFDAVILSLVLCSVADSRQVLTEAHRLLKPSGRLFFLEHVAAPSGSPLRLWQQRLEPFWKKLAGNCHLTRDTEQQILNSGFYIETITRQEMSPAPAFVRPTIRGIACKRP